MKRPSHFIADGQSIPSVTAAEMAEVDRVATEEVGLHLLSMMENAGRTLAVEVRERTPPGESITVFAGAGGNGGGGLVAAKHLANAGRDVRVVLDRDPDEYEGVPARQLGVLDATAVVVSTEIETSESDDEPSISGGTAVDALVGYGLQSAARGRVAELIEATEAFERVVSLDVPSGLDATTGERPGVAVTPDAVVTLALPKPGLAAVHDREGDPADLLLADIGIPAGVYDRAGIAYEDPFGGRDRVPLVVGV